MDKSGLLGKKCWHALSFADDGIASIEKIDFFDGWHNFHKHPDFQSI